MFTCCFPLSITSNVNKTNHLTRKFRIINENVYFRVEIRPENEYDKLLQLANEYFEDISNDIRPCGGFSLRYECACDFYQVPCHRSIQYVSKTRILSRLFKISI